MLTKDIHGSKETVNEALYELDSAIKLARKDKDKLLCLIVGYGSSVGTHKIKTAVLNALDEKKNLRQVKDYLIGSDCDIFSLKYQACKERGRIPESAKKVLNPGEIYIFL